jgi:hypothetical protein
MSGKTNMIWILPIGFPMALGGLSTWENQHIPHLAVEVRRQVALAEEAQQRGTLWKLLRLRGAKRTLGEETANGIQWIWMMYSCIYIYTYIYILHIYILQYIYIYTYIIAIIALLYIYKYIWVSNSCFMEFYGIEVLTVMQMVMYRNVNGWWIDDGCIDTNIHLRKWMIHGESQWHLITVCHRWPPENLGWTLHHSPSGSSHWGVSGLGAGKAYARNYPQCLTIWVFP